MPLVDVRNVAQAHLEAAIRDEANGKRFILCEKAMYLSELGAALKEKYGDKYPVTTVDMSRCFAGFIACFNGEMNTMVKMWNVPKVFDHSVSVDVLGIQYIDINDSVKEMADCLIHSGYIGDTKKE